MESKRKIYILQMYSNTIPSKVIKIATKYKYTHIAISLDENCNTIYSFGRRKTNSIINAGFVIEKKTGKFYSKFNKTICRIYELEVEKEKYEKLQKIIEEFKNNYFKYKYDNLGVFIRFLNLPITFKNKYVCSYFVADILEKVGIYKFNKKTFFIKPEDFENLTGTKEIYKGKYIKYKIRT